MGMRSVGGFFAILWRLVAKAVGTIVVVTFTAFATLEISIPNGFAGIVMPMGVDPRSDRGRQIIEEYNLGGNLFVRYFRWATDAVQGDFGRSLRGGTPVTEVLTHRLPISIQLMLVAVAIAILIGVPLGLFAASRDGRRSGRLLDMLLGFMQSMPIFLTPIFLIWLFAVKLQWLPAFGWVRISASLPNNLRNLLMPVAALAFAEIGFVARTIRADVVRVLREDFVVAAVGKGLGTWQILFRHALRPASLGLLNVVGMNIGALLSGAVIIEIIFAIGGLGQVFLEAMLNRDLPVVLGMTTYTVVVYMALNALVDLAMFAADPRIRRG